MSPRRMLVAHTAHCFEGAIFAAAVLAYHGHKPLLLDLQAARGDFDHVVAPFKSGRYWGAISKTNHGVLRYREPVYASIRELALSYFHEYFLQSTGKKTLRAYSAPFNLSKIPLTRWLTPDYDLIDLVNALEDSKHFNVAPAPQLKNLRTADTIEIKMAEHVEWPKKRTR